MTDQTTPTGCPEHHDQPDCGWPSNDTVTPGLLGVWGVPQSYADALYYWLDEDDRPDVLTVGALEAAVEVVSPGYVAELRGQWEYEAAA